VFGSFGGATREIGFGVSLTHGEVFSLAIKGDRQDKLSTMKRRLGFVMCSS
jgi:hypothetical protein